MNRQLTLGHVIGLLIVIGLIFGGIHLANQSQAESLKSKCQAEALAAIQLGINYRSPDCR